MDQVSQKISFQDIISSSITNINNGSVISAAAIITALISSLLCALIITWTYKKSYQGAIYQKSFSLSIILLCLITTSVIMVISGNLILSLGMVGALSIIRFRSAIKDPIDIVYMFWAVSVGISNGIFNFKVAFLSSIFISIIVMILKDMPQRGYTYMLVCKFGQEFESQVMSVISDSCEKYLIKSKTINNGETEIIFEIFVKDKNPDILRKTENISGVIDVTMLSYSNNLLDK